MASARRSISVILRAEIAAYKKDMEAAAAATRKVSEDAAKGVPQATSVFGKLQQSVSRNRDEISSLSTGLGLAGTALTAFAALSVSKFADFDQAMSNVQAATAETEANMERLREAALAAGAETVYSATEAAAAIEELSKAGVATADILGGGLSGALNLAASDGIAVADAASIAATAMTQFGLSGQDVTHIADLLASGAAAAQGGVGDLGEALNQSGLVASQFGLDIDTTVGTLSAFAKAGLLGSDAGTSFKTMLLALANPSKESAALMAELGINAYDAQGSFVGVADLAGQLQANLGGLTQAQRDQALAQIFGNDAIRAANVLFEQGESGINGWIDAVDQQGFAAEQAATRMNNLRGDLEGLSGAFETALIGAGEGANGPLRFLVQEATEAVNAFGRLPDAAQQATVGIAGAGGLALVGIAAVGKLTVAASETTEALQRMGVISDTTAGKVGKVGVAAGKIAGVAAGMYAVVNVLDAITDSSDKTAAGLEETTSALLGLDGANVNSLFQGLGSDFDDFGGALDLLVGGGVNNNLERFGSSLNSIFFGGRLQDQVKDAREQMQALGDALGAMVAAGDAQEAENLFNDLAEAAAEQGVSIEELEALMPGYTEALAGAANAQAQTQDETIAATTAIVEQTDALQDNLDAMREAAGIVLDEMNARSEWRQSLDDATAAIEENGRTLDTNTQAGRDNEDALLSLASSGLDLIASMKANGSSVDELRGSLSVIRDNFIDTATSMGLSADEAAVLADNLELIPGNVSTNVTVTTSGAQATIDSFMARNRVLRLDAIVQAGGNTGGGYATGGAISGPGSAISDSILARLSNGEHVFTASDVARMGGQDAVYRFRSLLQSGTLQGFRTGGAVGGRSLDYWQDSLVSPLELLRMRARLRDLERDMREREQTRNGGSRFVVRGIDRRVLGAEIGELRKEIQDATTARRVNQSKSGTIAQRINRRDRVKEQQQERAERAREDRGERLSLQTDLTLDLRRGTLMDQVTSGNGLAVVDQMRQWSQNTAIGKPQRQRLLKTAQRAEKTLQSLYGRLERAQETLGDVQQVYDSVRGGLMGEGRLSAFTGGTLTQTETGEFVEGGATGKSIAAGAKSTADRLRTFSDRLISLRKAGASQAVLTEVASLGSVVGIKVADELLADRASLRSLNDSFQRIETGSNRAGLAVGLSVDGASGLNLKVAGGELGSGLVDSLNKNVEGVGKGLAQAFASALGLKVNTSGTGVVRKAAGGPIFGPGTGTSDSVPILASNGEYMIKAASVRKYGTAFMDAVNTGQYGRFAQGGQIGSPLGVYGAGTTVVQVAAPDLDGLRIDGTFRIDGDGLGRIVDGRIRQGNQQQARRVRGLHRAGK